MALAIAATSLLPLEFAVASDDPFAAYLASVMQESVQALVCEDPNLLGLLDADEQTCLSKAKDKTLECWMWLTPIMPSLLVTSEEADRNGDRQKLESVTYLLAKCLQASMLLTDDFLSQSPGSPILKNLSVANSYFAHDLGQSRSLVMQSLLATMLALCVI